MPMRRHVAANREDNLSDQVDTLSDTSQIACSLQGRSLKQEGVTSWDAPLALLGIDYALRAYPKSPFWALPGYNRRALRCPALPYLQG